MLQVVPQISKAETIMEMAEMKMTKAKTAGARRRDKKRGRPCKPDVARADSGRISRSSQPSEAPDVLARRKRVALFGGDVKTAGDQNRGTVIGRLYLSREISYEQFETLQKYDTLASDYLAVMSVPDSLKSKVSGRSLSDTTESDEDVRARWTAVLRSVAEAQKYERGNLYAALQYMVSRDEFFEHMVGDLRLAANAIHRHFSRTKGYVRESVDA